ncbi:MAG: choice-of-anchor L domain-containing protein [Bacteroidetes bacterium]|nr:choice-of-anchor L domain-containing protein [Bacteroidota bacterium]
MSQPLSVQQKTAAQLVNNVLLGNGVTVSNITYNGDPQAIGFFKGATSNIGLDSGIIMTTGVIQDAPGPNSMFGASTSHYTSGDPDLDILAGLTTYDAAIIEFDFIPKSDTVQFRYVFASEEYMEFVNPLFPINDAFAFIITGVTVAMPASNIALIPGTTTPININNINLNNYPNFYVDNGDGWGTGTAPDGLTVNYDGFTKVFTAIAAVQCGETYHIKLAIADGSDWSYDSGVFIEAGSFSSKSVVSIKSDLFQGAAQDQNTVYENNGSINICFDRGTKNISKREAFKYTLSGTAENGVDYVYLPDSLIFQAGEDSVCITIQAITDNIVECKEDIHFDINEIGACDSLIANFTFYIQDTCVSYFYIPTAFTPDGNGNNDLFMPQSAGVLSFELAIYNRWGDLVFQTTDPTIGWDGTTGGKNAPQGVYICKYSVESVYGDFKEEDKISHVVLIR